MTATSYPTLVRDRTPGIATEPHLFRRAGQGEFNRLLDTKLDATITEWRGCHDPTALAEVLAVVRALAERDGIGWAGLIAEADAKKIMHGEYDRGIVCLGPQGDDL